jgi:hypothetical protein
MPADWDIWTLQNLLSAQLALLWMQQGVRLWEREERIRRLRDRGIMTESWPSGRISWEHLQAAIPEVERSLEALRRDGLNAPEVRQILQLIDQVARGDRETL